MPIISLNDMGTETLEADVAIVGGGACGLTLARALAAPERRVVLLESGGRAEDAAHETLNAVESAPENWSAEAAQFRDRFHRNLTQHWTGARQSYGVRCRGLGGSTQAWAGKSAPFEPVDYSARDWVPRSGWPVTQETLAPFIDAASALLNLGPPIYDAAMWEALDRRPPPPQLAHEAFESRFWQFARSRRAADIMRFGADFLAEPPDHVTVITHATATEVTSDAAGAACTGVRVRSLDGAGLTVTAPLVVLAAGAVENARLLLISGDEGGPGLGNRHGQVGRCLMDHPLTTVARARPGTRNNWSAWFGLYGLRREGRVTVHMHGLGLAETFQRTQKALNGAVFVTEELAADDPFSALRRLARRRSERPLADVAAVARSPLRLSRGIAARAVERGHLPAPVSRFAVNTALRFFPNTVARDFQRGSLPAKLSGLRFEATTEQPPAPENRVTLGAGKDAFGLPLPRVHWTAGTAARDNLLRIGTALQEAMASAGEDAPIFEDWVERRQPEAARVIDLGHSLGTTRMSADPKNGVVDGDCAVHGVRGLYVAGGSVFPTSGHANPTLMMLALTLRLAAHLRARQG